MNYYKKTDSLGNIIDYIVTEKAPDGYYKMSPSEISEITTVGAVIEDDPEFL